jgi:hypothetical protein
MVSYFKILGGALIGPTGIAFLLTNDCNSCPVTPNVISMYG